MKVLKVTTNGKAEIIDICPTMNAFIKEMRGVPKDTRPFIDKRIVMLVNSEPSSDEEINKGISFERVCGDVIFLRSTSDGYDYAELSEDMTNAIINRFDLILIEKKEKNIWTTTAQWSRDILKKIFGKK